MNLLAENNLKAKVKNLVRNFALMLLCYFLFFFIIRILDVFVFDLNFQKYEQLELLKILEKDPLKFVFLAAIVAPVIEECIFRSILKPNATGIKIFTCALLYLLGIVIIPEDAHWMLRYTLLFGSLIFCYYALGELVPTWFFKKICYWLHKYYLIIWFAGALIFGIAHIYNYVETFQLDLMLLFLILPRVIAGFFFGKVKIENKGLIWPVLMHSMNNSMVLIVLLPFT